MHNIGKQDSVVGNDHINDGVFPYPAKVDALKHMSMTPPTSKDEVKSLFCMLQSNKNFIPHLARKTIHIRNLLKKETDFVWTNTCQKEFKQIKEEFSEKILLSHFDPELETEIHFDAHQSGLPAILIQVYRVAHEILPAFHTL